MKKKLLSCTRRKTLLIEKMNEFPKISVDEWSAYTYQWKQILDDMCEITRTYVFTSRKKECFFFEELFAEVQSYYLFCRESALFYSVLPASPLEREAYISQKIAQYTSYRLQFFQCYTAFCANELAVDCSAIKAYILAKDSQEEWLFFDPRYPALFGAYFGALRLIVSQIEQMIAQGVQKTRTDVLQWRRSKLDLCLLSYAVSCCNGIHQERESLLKWAEVFGKLFGIDISTHYFQTLTAFKKRKDISTNLLAEMHQLIIDKYNDEV